MLSDVIRVYFRHQKAPGIDFVERGDYRLVQGNRKSIVGPTEWSRIEKVGLKVEMSIILRTQNRDKAKCPSCLARFEGGTVDGWAQWQVQMALCVFLLTVTIACLARGNFKSKPTFKPNPTFSPPIRLNPKASI
jgi:hypothetical protein